MLNNASNILIREDIPNDDELYIRLCDFHFDNGRLLPTAFEPRLDPDDCGVKSANWSKYSTPIETMGSTANPYCNKKCAKLEVSFARDIGLEVDHYPTKENLAHSGIHTEFSQQPLRNGCKKGTSFSQPSRKQLVEICNYVMKNNKIVHKKFSIL